MKTYNISQLKTHLSQAIQLVKKGSVIVVLDRNTPVANLVPVQEREGSQQIRPALKKSPKESLYAGISLEDDIQDFLRQDREKR